LVVVLKPKVKAVDVIPYLYQYTDLQSTFSSRSLFIDGTKPVELAPYQVVESWLKWRLGRLVVKFTSEKTKLESRLHIIDGLIKALDAIDLVISIIRAAKDKTEAKTKLMTNRSLKLSADQAEAVLDMRLRQLTSLDNEELQNEKKVKSDRVGVLTILIDNEDERKSYIVNEVKEIGKKFGFSRKSSLIDVQETAMAGPQRTANVNAAPKMRFMKIDATKGIVEQLKKPRGANLVLEKEKVVFITSNGMFKKVPPTFKGPLYEGPTEIISRGTESEITSRQYLVVFELGTQLKAMSLSGEDLCKTTTKGKSFLPADAKLVYMGEDSYSVSFSSKRKKPVVLTPKTVKAARPGAKGIKVCEVADLA